jgi:hypothetical protein
MDVIELNEAFAAQAQAVTRDLGCLTMRHVIRMAGRLRLVIRWGERARL